MIPDTDYSIPDLEMFFRSFCSAWHCTACQRTPSKLKVDWAVRSDLEKNMNMLERNLFTLLFLVPLIWSWVEYMQQRPHNLYFWGTSIFVNLLAWAAAFLFTQVFGMDPYLKKIQEIFSSLHLNVPAAHFSVLWECQDSALQHHKKFSCDLVVGKVKPIVRVYERKLSLLL